MSDEFEELEQIPWAALAASSKSPRNRYLSVAIGLVLLVAAAGWMATRGSSTAATTGSISAVATVPASTELVPATAPPPTVAVYSEADLMLIDAPGEERLAVMQAEWLVRDILTVDDDPLIRDRIDELLPGIDRPDTPAFVEWVSAFSVESTAPGRYLVKVAYRTLEGTEEGYVRQPAGALSVEMEIDVGGSTSLVGSPEPVVLPDLAGFPG